VRDITIYPSLTDTPECTHVVFHFSANGGGDRAIGSLFVVRARSLPCLVIYRVKLSPETPLPATVSLPILIRVGEPHAVAARSEAGELLQADYTRLVMDE
jgi:hypothetical protein